MRRMPNDLPTSSHASVEPERRGYSRRRRAADGTSAPRPLTSPAHGSPAPASPTPGAHLPPRVAILVAHGMGQQVKFETLDLLTTALRREARRRGDAEPDVAVRMVRFDDDSIARAELTLRDAQGGERELHCYEAYWAPLTEGQISARQTLAFLAESGWAGMVRSFKRCFHRFMFGREQRLPVGPIAGLAFFATLAVMLALTALTIDVGAVMISRLVHSGPNAWPEPRLFVDLTMDVLVFFASLALAGAGVGLAALARRRSRTGALRVPPGALTTLGWTLVWTAFPLVLGCGALAAWQVFAHRCPGVEHPFWCAWRPFSTAAEMLANACPSWLMTTLAMGLWASLLAVSLPARAFIIQLAGDVAIYVSSHRINRFRQTREEIQAASLKVARCVFEWIEPGESTPHYDRVIIAGHSLGSVIAYDALNAMLREDELDAGALDVAGRTSMFVTFGSPLDKTAFLFRNQRDEKSDVREALAAAVQPLIRDYAFRPRRWINLWSPNDWVGSELAYYDDTSGAGDGKRIENLVDPEATTPLLAHNEHWDGTLLGRTLFDEVTR